MRIVIVDGKPMSKSVYGQFQAACGCGQTAWVRQGKRATCSCGSRMTRTGKQRMVAYLQPAVGTVAS